MDLRPLTFAEVLDSAVAMYRKGFPTFVGILALTQVPALLVTVALNAVPASPAAFLGLSTTPAQDVARLVNSVLAVLTNGALQAYAGSFFGLGASDVWGAYRIALRRLLPLFAFDVVFGLTAVLGLLLAVVPGLLILGWWNLGHAAVVLEGAGPITAVRRSYRLSRGAFWRIMGALAIAGAIVVGVAFLVGLAVGLASLFGGLRGTANGLYVRTLVSVLPTLLAGGLPIAMQTVLYIDRRARVEAFDLEAALEAEP